MIVAAVRRLLCCVPSPAGRQFASSVSLSFLSRRVIILLILFFKARVPNVLILRQATCLASSHLAVLDSSRHSNSSSFQTVWSQRKKPTEPVLWGGDSATSASPLRVLATSFLEIAESRLPSTFAAAGGFVADPQPNDGSKQGAAPAPLDTPVVLALKRLWYGVGKDKAVSFPPAAAATERICSRDVPHPDDIDGPAIENGMEL